MEAFLMVVLRLEADLRSKCGAGSWWKRVLNLANSLVKYEVWTLRREEDPLAGVPILTSGTIFNISAICADFLFLNNGLFSLILVVLEIAIFAKLSDFLINIWK